LAGFYFSKPQKLDLAEKYARAGLKINGDRADAYLVMVRLLVQQQRWENLEALLAAAEKNIPDNLLPYYQAGLAILNEGTDFQRAERYFRKYLGHTPEPGAASLAHAHWRLGLVLEKENRKAEALKEIQTALALDSGLDTAKKDLKRLK
jgi:tetratricopeptide (TPR) repeat protein